MSDIFYHRILSLLVIGFSIWRLYARYKHRRLLTLSGGLHFNALMSMGVAPFLYTLVFQSLEGERLSKSDILANALAGYVCFTIGYGLFCLFESRRRYEVSLFHRKPFNHGEMTSTQLFILIMLVAVGVVGAHFGLSTSGAGTLFIIFYLLFYPMIILSVLKVNTRDANSMMLCAVLLLATFILVFISPWRSQLVLWMLSLIFGLAFRFRVSVKMLVGYGFIFGLLFLLVAPFLQYKKHRSGDSDYNLMAGLIQSQHITMDDRIEQSFGFISARVNGVREMGFVGNGLSQGLTDKRLGETYFEALQQLVPRIIWPSKPIFNYTSGYLIARQIMLLGWEDEYTSAAITIWPEGVVNFGPYFLLVFVPFVFFCATQVDRYTRKFISESAGVWLLDTTYFFIAFNLVSVVQFGTQFIWTFIVLWLFSKMWLTRYADTMIDFDVMQRPDQNLGRRLFDRKRVGKSANQA
jgi:hypothetical protein